MTVDSFKFLPRVIATYYQMTDRQPEIPIPWTPLRKPLNESKFGLVTTAGIYHKHEDVPFDLVREKSEPTWGDPTFRVLPATLEHNDVGVVLPREHEACTTHVRRKLVDLIESLVDHLTTYVCITQISHQEIVSVSF